MPAEACAIAISPSSCWRRPESPLSPPWCGGWTESDAARRRNCAGNCGAGNIAASSAGGRRGWSYEMARGMRWNDREGVAANARRELPPMVSAYFSQVREFLAEDPTPRKLHRLRLASKRLRYTLEHFRPCYPAGMQERLDALKKLQNFLGEINDAVASARLLRVALERKPRVRKFL